MKGRMVAAILVGIAFLGQSGLAHSQNVPARKPEIVDATKCITQGPSQYGVGLRNACSYPVAYFMCDDDGQNAYADCRTEAKLVANDFVCAGQGCVEGKTWIACKADNPKCAQTMRCLTDFADDRLLTRPGMVDRRIRNVKEAGRYCGVDIEHGSVRWY